MKWLQKTDASCMLFGSMNLFSRYSLTCLLFACDTERFSIDWNSLFRSSSGRLSFSGVFTSSDSKFFMSKNSFMLFLSCVSRNLHPSRLKATRSMRSPPAAQAKHLHPVGLLEPCTLPIGNLASFVPDLSAWQAGHGPYLPPFMLIPRLPATLSNEFCLHFSIQFPII